MHYTTGAGYLKLAVLQMRTSKYFHAATNFAGYTTQRDHGPICAERARGERRKYQGLGKLRLCLVRSTLQTTWNSYQRKQTRIANFIASRVGKITNGSLTQSLLHRLQNDIFCNLNINRYRSHTAYFLQGTATEKKTRDGTLKHCNPNIFHHGRHQHANHL